MSDARAAFGALRERAGDTYDVKNLHDDLDAVEHRVERTRAWRGVMTFGGGMLVLAGAVVIAMQLVGSGPVAPGESPSAAPSTTKSSVADEWPAWCGSATVVPGKPVGNLAGFEGWYNSTMDAPCDEWDQKVKDHPDTVWVNTSDNTLLEAYYRTSRDALGVYGTLSGGFVIPDPDPSWPQDRLVLIDPRTGEVLDVADPADYADLTSGGPSSSTDPSP